MAHVLLSEIIDIITAQYDEEPDSYVHGVSRTLVISHAKRVLQELNYAGMRSLRVAISEVYASGKVELPDDYVEYVKVYYCVGNYLIPAFWNEHINTAQWEGLKDFEEEVIQTETGRTIYSESGDYLAIMTRSNERVKDYGDLHCNCFLKGYKYDVKNNCFVFDYVPEGVTHVAIEYVADPLISEPNPDNLSVHKFFQKAIETGVYLRLVETRRNVPMNEKVRAKREWNIKYKDAVKELNAKPWEYVQVIMGWRHMRKCGFEGMGGQSIPDEKDEKIWYTARYDDFVCQKMGLPEYTGRYDGFVCQRIDIAEYTGVYDRFVCQRIEVPEYSGHYSDFVCQKSDNGTAPDPIEPESVVSMKLTKVNPSFIVDKNADLEVDWGDGVKEKNVFNHTYSDGVSEHRIIIYGEKDALTSLSCNKCEVSELDVSKSVSLTYLDCSDNQLTQLDVSQNTALTGLYCRSNQFSQLDVSQNTALRSLYCYSNQLTSLDVSQNTLVKYLDCSSNQLTSLDVTKNTVLIDLACSSNQLAQLDVTQNTALNSLACSENQLSSLDVSKNTGLTTLVCSENQLTSLDVSKSRGLSSLNCGSNELTSLDVSENTGLISLDCYSNKLTELELSNNTAMTYLNFRSNQLTQLDTAQNVALVNLNSGSNKLTSLDVSKSTGLSSLSCDSNQLTSLDVSKNLALTRLNCGSNKLTFLDVSQNSEVADILCGKNPFVTDESALKAFANTLPQREASSKGTLYISDNASAAWIKSICDAKNWGIR